MTLMQVLRNVITDKRSNSKDAVELILMLMLECLIAILEDYLEFMTNQAYIYTALYGKGLVGSGKLAHESCFNKGFEKFFNMKMVENLLGGLGFFVAVALGAVGSLAVGLMTDRIDENDEDEVRNEKLAMNFITSLSIIVSVSIGMGLVNNVVSGMTTCQMTIYIEDPDRFEN